jgi:toxin ParE1/3/4
VFLSTAARNLIRDALIWSRERFGETAAARYRDLMKQALADIAANPERPGSKARPELAISGVRSYHLFFSRDQARSELGIVRKPRHLIVYRSRGQTIEVIRILHDGRDLQRHIPQD